jgi:CDP-glycerol glycerophosphotransferase (TagB/SpsB family)
VRLVVKPHPAESAEPYTRAIRDAALTARVAPPRSELMELLVAADALVTVESLAAVEALVLGRPVLVLNMPTNLAEIVAQGMALGVAAGRDPGEALRRLLFDAETRAGLERARARYLQDVAHGVDGRATERILALIREGAGLAC